MSISRIGNAVKAPFITVFRAYNNVAMKHPFGTGVITTGLKTSAADLFAQKVVEQKEDFDWRRHSMFCLFGFGYLGCFQYYLYNNLFARWRPAITAAVGARFSAPVKVFIDQCIHHPTLYFPCFYLLKGFLEGRPVADTFERYREDLWENLKALWTIWVPAQLFNFSVVPFHLRIPFVAAVSMAWTIILSVMRGAMNKSNDDENVPVPVTTAAAP
uniref:Peroxisomal membrane protein n=1 Tax=Polytomella parva TaxID=51329 RepID=A0A7S0V9X4_9CHLO|mmetsp:Transcript_33835/g.61095  ORF Transcript_33835/g.61095 Transcript_33835/m.61095 type:complete len:215 (+) Transcript_33835:159-803(+)|eukprot:CAMPEP_0175042370 /NCGR_PEP_ID=MMETSP0052_2-20121109/2526_1 /TAXON_ID=51329 ORGANISM="Polytomella parva, Strain SAG 63-3" /NCGR_SAMPLE_ID=MMETSP0052_2 /ASSEMBLY_ACC=CAM_ASM_000194 /LENGTH=214 /DNA_ID=CAMNT_0016305175 /DNA_START=142 /DNA_END=786 /DNA_ORIENTATION=+